MKVHQIEMESIKAPGDLVSFLEDNDVRRGDTVKVITAEKEILFTLLFIFMALYLYYTAKKDRQEDGEKILDSIFKEKSPDDVEYEIQVQYGIKIETEYIDREKQEWQSLSHQHFINSYDAAEPDYDHMVIKEPNPACQV